MKKIFFFFTGLFLFISACHAQVYELRGFKSGCLEGNCENGQGVYAFFEKWYDEGPIFKTTPAVMINYYSGSFENNKFRKGRLYRQYVEVKATKKTLPNTYTSVYNFSPITKINPFTGYHADDFIYAGEFNEKNQYHGRGKLFRNNYYYEGIFNNGDLVVGTRYSYTPGDTVVSMQGYFKKNFCFLYGTMEHADGIHRTGLFQDNGIYKQTPVPIGLISSFDYLKGREWEEYYHLSKTDTFNLLLARQEHSMPAVAGPEVTLEVSIKQDPYLSSYTPAKLLYTGQVKNGLPHGKGRLINLNYEQEGISFFYHGTFKNGQPYGSGYLYHQDISGTLVYGPNSELTYISVSYSNPKAEYNRTSAFSGFMSKGTFNGKGTKSIYIPFKLIGTTETQSGYFVNGVFHGTVHINSVKSSGTATYDHGVMTSSSIKPSSHMLKTGSIVIYKGQKAAVVHRPPNLQSGVMLSNGQVIPEGSFDFILTGDAPDNFMTTCYSCKGSGRQYTVKKTGTYTSYTTVTEYSGSTISGDYLKIKTVSSPDTYTQESYCEICKGAGKIFKK